MKLLKYGSRGDDVKKLQTKLKELGYFITVDGLFGKGTEEFVKRFQKENKLFPDGIVGDKTWDALFQNDKNTVSSNENIQKTPFQTSQTTKTLYLDKAMELKGAPYKTGGMDKNGVDCSGLVNYATGQKTRVWSTSSNTNPPGNWNKLNVKASTIDNFILQLKRGDLLLWKGHVAFYAGNLQLFHAQKAGTFCGFTNDLKLYWLKVMNYPVIYRQII